MNPEVLKVPVMEKRRPSGEANQNASLCTERVIRTRSRQIPPTLVGIQAISLILCLSAFSISGTVLAWINFYTVKIEADRFLGPILRYKNRMYREALYMSLRQPTVNYHASGAHIMWYSTMSASKSIFSESFYFGWETAFSVFWDTFLWQILAA